MLDPNMTLLFTALGAVLQELESGADGDLPWNRASESLAHYEVGEEQDAELAAAVQARDTEALKGIFDGWMDGTRLMLERDRGVLKRAMKAYRKRLKVTILSAESSLGGGPMSSGRKSTIVGVLPPDRYPTEVWDELVRQKRLLAGDRGTYELPPGG